MRKDPVEFRTQIARRRKQFVALLLGGAMALMPTVTVMAQEYVMAPVGEEKEFESPQESKDPAQIKPILNAEELKGDDVLKWNFTSKYYVVNGQGEKEYKPGSGHLAVLYYDTQGNQLAHYKGGDNDQDKDKKDYFSDSYDNDNEYVKIKGADKFNISDFDHWKVEVDYKHFNDDGNKVNEETPMDDANDWKFGAPKWWGVIVRLTAVTEYHVYFDPSYPVESRLEGLGKTTKDHKISEDDLNEVSQYVSERLPEGGYDLEGFYTERDGKGDKITKDYKFSSNTTAYANWVKKCTVTFHSNYPNGSKEETQKKETKNGKIENFPKFSCDGYTLDGFSKTKDGEIISKNTVFEKDTDLYAIWKKGKDPDKDKDKHDDGGHDDDDDKVVKEDTPPAYHDPMALNGHYYVNNVIDGGAVLARSQQGPAAMAAFMNGLPAGWKMAFPFVISTGGKNDYSLKNGTIKLEVPAGNQGKGREFAIMAIDKNGLVTVIYDTDKTENHITVSPNVEGYAYMLIYKD